jgi:Helix-turn-helix domain
MKSNAMRKETLGTAGQHGYDSAKDAARGFQPKSARAPHHINGNTGQFLRMYTEEEVSEILQVSLSQLRKWRMRKHQGNTQGPPFRKIGRLVRYSGMALQAYINGDEQDSHPNQE